MLGGCHDVGLRRIRDDDAAFGRRVDVDVVDAHARASDHLERIGALDDFAARRGNDLTADETAAAASKTVLCSVLDMVNANFRAQV